MPNTVGQAGVTGVSTTFIWWWWTSAFKVTDWLTDWLRVTEQFCSFFIIHLPQVVALTNNWVEWHCCCMVSDVCIVLMDVDSGWLLQCIISPGHRRCCTLHRCWWLVMTSDMVTLRHWDSMLVSFHPYIYQPLTGLPCHQLCIVASVMNCHIGLAVRATPAQCRFIVDIKIFLLALTCKR